MQRNKVKSRYKGRQGYYFEKGCEGYSREKGREPCRYPGRHVRRENRSAKALGRSVPGQQGWRERERKGRDQPDSGGSRWGGPGGLCADGVGLGGLCADAGMTHSETGSH